MELMQFAQAQPIVEHLKEFLESSRVGEHSPPVETAAA
jgi:hypothetical protein